MVRTSLLYTWEHTISVADRENVIADTAVHEIGHLFGLTKGLFPKNLHIDLRKKKPSSPNHEDTDQCVMSYNRSRDNGIVEFDIDCLNFIREAAEPR